MIMDPEKKILKPFDFNNINSEVPELNKLECFIDTFSFDMPIDSSNINTSIWEKIGDCIFENYYNYISRYLLKCGSLARRSYGTEL